jgi:hypothetical protein
MKQDAHTESQGRTPGTTMPDDLEERRKQIFFSILEEKYIQTFS